MKVEATVTLLLSFIVSSLTHFYKALATVSMKDSIVVIKEIIIQRMKARRETVLPHTIIILYHILSIVIYPHECI